MRSPDKEPDSAAIQVTSTKKHGPGSCFRYI